MKIKKVLRKFSVEGKRIILRPLKESDADAYIKVDDSARINGKKVKIDNLIKAKKFIKQSWIYDSCYLGIFLKENNELIGRIELCHMSWWDNNTGELAYKIIKKFRRKGFATEAIKILIDYCFKKLKYRKIYADTDQYNIPSQKTLIKAGFKLEGRIRERRKIKGKWLDELDYGLLKKEWKVK